MTWFLILVLAAVAVFAMLIVFALVSVLVARTADDELAEQARVEREVRRAEHRLHELARTSFQDMLAEARSHGFGERQ